LLCFIKIVPCYFPFLPGNKYFHGLKTFDSFGRGLALVNEYKYGKSS